MRPEFGNRLVELMGWRGEPKENWTVWFLEHVERRAVTYSVHPLKHLQKNSKLIAVCLVVNASVLLSSNSL